MLAFLKKWYQAYRDEKGDRLYAEVEAERNALLSSTTMSPNKVLNVWANTEKEHYDEYWVHNYDNR
ncbi:hypothetical protein [Vibrio sp.]|uniref:hypothetical protein n=1 Tax=Vibrio sp. TaxID=678 RepID=UPI003F6B350A